MAKILILEDDYELAHSWYLTLNAHEVDIGLTSFAAIDLETHGNFDLFVVDLMSSGHDETIRATGQAFLTHLSDRYSQTEMARRVIGVSGFMFDRDPNFAAKAFVDHGVLNVLKKPFTPTDLANCVESILSVKKVRAS